MRSDGAGRLCLRRARNGAWYASGASSAPFACVGEIEVAKRARRKRFHASGGYPSEAQGLGRSAADMPLSRDRGGRPGQGVAHDQGTCAEALRGRGFLQRCCGPRPSEGLAGARHDAHQWRRWRIARAPSDELVYVGPTPEANLPAVLRRYVRALPADGRNLSMRPPLQPCVDGGDPLRRSSTVVLYHAVGEFDQSLATHSSAEGVFAGWNLKNVSGRCGVSRDETRVEAMAFELSKAMC